MKRNRKILSGVVAGLIVIGAVVAWAYRDLYAREPRFEPGYYHGDDADKARAFSYEPYARTLTKHVDERGMVNYAGLKKDPSDLDRFVRAIGWLDPKVYERWDENARIAFWTNAYNALTLKLIVDQHPIKCGVLRSLRFPRNSIRQISNPWTARFFLGMGRRMSLDDVEHKRLRGKFNEPRIHVAMVCAAMGCPTLRNEPYSPEKLDAQLDDQARRFMTDPAKFRIDRKGKKVYLSSIFKWFGGDFVKKYKPEKGFLHHDDPTRAALNFASRYVAKGEDAAFLRDEKYAVEYLDYDWSLNEQPKPPAAQAKGRQKKP